MDENTRKIQFGAAAISVRAKNLMEMVVSDPHFAVSDDAAAWMLERLDEARKALDLALQAKEVKVRYRWRIALGVRGRAEMGWADSQEAAVQEIESRLRARRPGIGLEWVNVVQCAYQDNAARGGMVDGWISQRSFIGDRMVEDY